METNLKIRKFLKEDAVVCLPLGKRASASFFVISALLGA
jgi:hypothetical protein